MNEQTTMSDAAATTSGNPSSPMSGIPAATAEALYGNQQKGSGDQTQASADAARNAESDANKTETSNNAPEKYEFKAPEGRQFDAEVIGSFSEVAKELNLSQESAQKVLDRVAPKMAERQAAQLEAIRSQWTESSRSDKEFGGDKLNENLVTAKRALDSFGTPELRTLLNESGLGNHPELVRFMFRAGQSISEDRFVGSSNGSTPSKGAPRDFNSQAAAMYNT